MRAELNAVGDMTEIIRGRYGEVVLSSGTGSIEVQRDILNDGTFDTVRTIASTDEQRHYVIEGPIRADMRIRCSEFTNGPIVVKINA